MACYKSLFKKRSEWLKHRGIGGSDLAIIMGESKWGSLDDLYNRMIGLPVKVASNETMEKGTKAESNIRNLFALDMADEFKVDNPPAKGAWLFTRTDKPYITVTPDGLITSKKDGSMGGLEIKYVSVMRSEDRKCWGSNSIPGQYYWQLIQYLLVMDKLEYVYLNAHLKYFNPIENNKWQFDHAEDRLFVLYRKDVKEDLMKAELSETSFYEKNVQRKERPSLVLNF